MKKPPFISHYLVLKDLIAGIDARAKSDTIFYLTSRIENIKVDLVKEGIEFIEDISKETTYSYYKPYLLIPSENNLNKAIKLLKRYETKKVLDFISQKQGLKLQKNTPY
ncbi:hypothetical protein N5T82_02715 [Aliarcobacter cryaerophilus]|uniref:hypothetical protein n=1 Tax=Aliarcobacter cryaerophilus TaxID=28198 RepID=UPI0021B67330|nr:hypothetical protein [Aliarcobacter cryaerophilus]MCT7538757.1 hypothetical protein [Aliarcobacter cryaerophilus]